MTVAILDEIFNVQYRLNNMHILCFEEIFDRYECVVYKLDNFGMSLYFDFERAPRSHLKTVKGTLRLDRIRREFGIDAINDGYTIVPVRGGIEIIEQFLSALK